MTECGWLSDRMPAVVVGRAQWTPEEVRHLNGCRACQEEWALVQVAGRLGDRAGVTFESSAMTSLVLQRLGREREAGRLRRTWSFTALAAAAAIAAAVWTGGKTSLLPPSGTVATGRLAIPLPELESLQASELDSVLLILDEPNVSGAPVDEPGLTDLNSDELESVLDSWEG